MTPDDRFKTIVAAATTAHEINKAWCEFNGDMSQPSWDDAPEWQRQSAIAGIQFHIDMPDAGDNGSHEAWMTHKLIDGWQYGPVKDAEKKEHPCLVPFEMLPPEQQFKDKLFRLVAHGFISLLPEIAA